MLTNCPVWQLPASPSIRNLNTPFVGCRYDLILASIGSLTSLRDRSECAYLSIIRGVGAMSTLAVIAYPEQGDKATASAWNVVAAQNNRVEFHLVPTAGA